MVLRILVLLISSQQLVLSCQPPMPSFRAAAPAAAVPPSPAFVMPAGGLVSGVSYHQPSVVQGGPGPNIAHSLDQELEVLGREDNRVPTSDLTPYPGYIPPPPEFPSAAQEQDHFLLRAPSNDALQRIHDGIAVGAAAPQSPFGCPSVVSSLQDVVSCLHFLPPAKLEESSLYCDFEPATGCRFQPTSPSFQVARMNEASQYSALSRISGKGEERGPEGAFMALIERNGLPKDQALVISTPITCQSGNGTLSFDHWVLGNAELRLQVCTSNHMTRSCTPAIEYPANGRTEVEVVHPESTVFDIEIMISHLKVPTLFVIDNIDYRADLCETRREEARHNEIAASAELVESFFEEEGPVTTDDIDEEDEKEEKEERNTVVEIPSRPPSDEALRMFNAAPIIGPPGQIQMETTTSDNDLPPSITPFEESSEVPPAAAEDTDVSLSPASPTSSTSSANSSICEALKCSFDGTFCGYRNYKNQTLRTSDWNLGSDKVGNPHTGVRSNDKVDGGFLYVGTDSGDHTLTTYILESPEISLDEDVKLLIDIYRRSNDITLQICLNNPFYCPYTVSPFEKDVYWKDAQSFNIPKSTERIFLKAIQWRKFKWLAIDNVRISSEHC